MKFPQEQWGTPAFLCPLWSRKGGAFWMMAALLSMTPTMGRPAEDTSIASRRWWSEAAEQAVKQAGTNQAQIIKALSEVAASQRDGMQFLVENMGQGDLE